MHAHTPARTRPRARTPPSSFIHADRIPDPHNVELWCKVDGVERQRGHTSDMIFSIPKLISYIR